MNVQSSLLLLISSLTLVVNYVVATEKNIHNKIHDRKQKNGKLHRKIFHFHHRQLPHNCEIVCHPPTPQSQVQNATHPDNSTGSDEDSDYDDANDNEIAVESTSLPPNFFADINLNNEAEDPGLVHGNPLVDFIVVKHRFSNETNLAFPPYLRHFGRGKKRSDGHTIMKSKKAKNSDKNSN